MTTYARVELSQIEYLGVWNEDNRLLKIYRSQVNGSEVENGLIVRQAEYLVDQLHPSAEGTVMGFLVLLKGITKNFIHVNIMDDNAFIMRPGIYATTISEPLTFKESEGEIFRSNRILKDLIDYEYSLLKYINRKHQYLNYHYS